jgi:peroxiredoxin Q/BCP
MPKTSKKAKTPKRPKRKTAARKSVTRKTASKKKVGTRKTTVKKKVTPKKKVVARKRTVAPKKQTSKAKPKAKAKVPRPKPAKVVPTKPVPSAAKPTKSRLIKANAVAPASEVTAGALVLQPEIAGMVLQAGQPAPDFRLPSHDGRVMSLTEFRGRKVVLFFYPRDDTPGCTKEACSFRDGRIEIEQRGAVILGISVDPVDSHEMFHEKYDLNFPLLSDELKQTVQAYGVWVQKSFEGRTWMATERTTFIIDEEGKIARIFPKVQVEGHFAEVLAAL